MYDKDIIVDKNQIGDIGGVAIGKGLESSILQELILCNQLKQI